MPNSRRPTTIQSVDRAAAILKALAAGPGRLGVSELADRLGLARPTVHGLLQTLLAQGFVEQDRVSEKYQLGAGLLQLGYSYLDVNELRSRSITYAAQLAVRTKFAVRVGVMHGPNAVVVHHVFRPDATLQILEVGSQLPLHASALGKALLAFAPGDVIDNLMSAPLERLTKRTSNAAALRIQLNTIRLHAIATERDEAVLGESSVAAPIFDRAGNAVGAIAVVGDTDRVFSRGPARGLASCRRRGRARRVARARRSEVAVRRLGVAAPPGYALTVDPGATVEEIPCSRSELSGRFETGSTPATCERMGQAGVPGSFLRHYFDRRSTPGMRQPSRHRVHDGCQGRDADPRRGHAPAASNGVTATSTAASSAGSRRFTFCSAPAGPRIDGDRVPPSTRRASAWIQSRGAAIDNG